MNFAPLLSYIENYTSLTEDESLLLQSKVKLRRYLKGQFIVQQGDVCNTTNFIVFGCTKMFHSDLEGMEHIVMFSEENWWSSDLGSFISQSPADYNIQCTEPTTVIQFSYQNQEELFEKIPKLERFFRIILEKALVASQQRIVRNFSLTAKERYLYFKEQYPTIEQRIPQYMIASYLGITKEFLSKIKSQLILEQ
jgi:CRP-like cAMP-binding protein